MISNSQIRNCALRSLEGKWGASAVLMLVAVVIGGSFGTISTSLLLIPAILLLPMDWGVTVAFLEVARGGKPDLGWLIKGYNRFAEIFLTMLLKCIYIYLWTLLLIVPGIIKAYSYALTEYILQDDPDCKYDEAIEKSMKMMDGHKMQMFLLDLSFIGWGILCLLTLGIGFLFLKPYMNTAHAHFYEELKADMSYDAAMFEKV
jgi:uncharacterized membrane protein